MPITLNSVSKSYGEKAVLRSFSHSFPDGEITCVLGPSGCGKTTLLRLIAGLEAPDSGSIRSAEGSILGSQGKKISAVFQEDRLFENLSAGKNVLLTARTGFKAADARALLTSLGLPDTHQAVREYSGGMKRRVAIARALAADYDILLLDEPLTALDAASRESVLRRIQQLCAGKTCIWVTHFPEDAAALGCSVLRLNAASG